MSRYLLIFFFVSFLYGYPLLAFQQRIDDLHANMRRSKNPEARAVAMYELIAYHRRSNTDSSLWWCHEMAKFSKENNLIKLEALAWKEAGDVSLHLANYTYAKEALLKAYERSESIGDADEQTSILLALSNMCIMTGDLHLSRIYIERAEKVLKNASPQQKAAILQMKGKIFVNEGRYLEADTAYQAALKLWNVSNNQDAGGKYSDIGNSFYWQGQYQKALSYYTKGFDEAYSKGHAQEMGYLSGNQALAYHAMGNYTKAMELYEKSLHYSTQSNANRDMANVLSNISDLYADVGILTQAHTYAQRALAINESIQDSVQIGNSYRDLGNIFLKQQNYASAKDWLLKAMGIYRKLKQKPKEAITWENLGMVYLGLNLLDSAQRSYDLAETIASEAGMDALLAEVCYGRGILYMRRNKTDSAEAVLQKALLLFEGKGIGAPNAKTWSAMSELYASSGNFPKAWESLQKATAIKDSLASQSLKAQMLSLRMDEEADRTSRRPASREKEHWGVWAAIIGANLLILAGMYAFFFSDYIKA